jgi:hypothetical protein
MDMTFRRATNILGMSASEVAAEFGVRPQTIRQMRLQPSATNYRTPPLGWEKRLVRLAQRRGKELNDLIEQLARQA